MKKSKFTETQIVKALKEHEVGRSVEDICRDLGIYGLHFIIGSQSMAAWNRRT